MVFQVFLNTRFSNKYLYTFDYLAFEHIKASFKRI